MSSYLTNLAARSFEQPLLIRPRLASVFEPPPGVRLVSFIPSAAQRTGLVQSTSRAEDRIAPRGRSTEKAANAPMQPATELETVIGREPPRSRAINRLNDRLANSVAPPPAESTSNSEVHLEGSDPPARPARRKVPADSIVAANEKVDASRERSARTMPKATVPAEESNSARRRSHFPAPTEALVTRTQPDRPRPGVTTKPQVTLLAAQPQPREAPEIAREAPTIRITIGRVDVRAIMPPSPLPSRPAAAQRSAGLSLDDYLKQRNGA